MPFNVFSADLQHESNRFSLRRTCIEDFRQGTLLEGATALATLEATNNGLAGSIDCATEFGWNLRHSVSAIAGPAGPVLEETYEKIVGQIVAAAESESFDGALLNLHGAMVCEHVEDAEGELLMRLRRVLGPDVPMAITLDPHANVTQAMCDLASIVVSYKTYPHVDRRETGQHAARILQQAMIGETRPQTLRVAVPMLEEANGGRTDTGPMVGYIAQARGWETSQGNAYAVSINGAFPQSDIRDTGATVLVTYGGGAAPHLDFAQRIAAEMWQRRREVITTFHTVAAVTQMAREHAGTGGPLVLADFADNPGGGAYGDSTALLEAMIEAGVGNASFGALYDPKAASELYRAGVGAEVRISIGGKTDPRFGGGPLDVTGKVILVSDGRYTGRGPMIGGLTSSFGPTAVLRVGGIDVLVVSVCHQILDLEQFRAFGIDPAARRVVALKSMQHFRADFEPIAARVEVCDSGALCTMDYRRLPFTHVRRPIWPLDEDILYPESQPDAPTMEVRP